MLSGPALGNTLLKLYLAYLAVAAAKGTWVLECTGVCKSSRVGGVLRH